MQNKGELCRKEIFEKTYRLHVNDLYRYLRYRFGNTVDAEDVTQTIFLTLWEKCSQFDLKNIKSLIFTMGKNRAINLLKRAQAQHENLMEGVLSYDTPEKQMEEKEFHKKLMTALGTLKAKEREVFLMNRISDLTYAEIAVRLSISEKTVEKRMHYALKHLQEKLQISLKRK